MQYLIDRWPFYALLAGGLVALLAGVIRGDTVLATVGLVLSVLGAFGAYTGPLRVLHAPGFKAEFDPRIEKTNQALEAAVTHTNRPDGLERARKIIPAVTAIGSSTILWVDDHPERNTYEASLLQATGADLVFARSTEEGMRVIETGDFDLIITDLLRDSDPNAGLAFIEKLGQIDIDRPIVVYTFDPNGRHRRALELGALAVARTPPELIDAVLRALLLAQMPRLDAKAGKAP